MIKRLRRKFIFIVMGSLLGVLLILIGGMNMANYINMNARADSVIDLLLQNNGEFPDTEKPDRPGTPSQKPDEAAAPPENGQMPHGMSPETPFNSRYFTLFYSMDGDLLQTNTAHIFSVSDGQAATFVHKVSRSGKMRGSIDKYRYGISQNENGTLYVFLEISGELNAFRTSLWTSIGMSAMGAVVVFLLVLLFSELAIKPVSTALEKQKQFITDAGHELKTPLTIMSADLEMIEMDDCENEWTQSLKNQIERLSSLTRNLMTLARMDEESVKLNFSDFCISDAVADSAHNFDTLALSQNKKFSIEVQENLTYHGNESAIRHLVFILMDNAMKYSDENGNINIKLAAQGKKIELTVHNSVEKIEVSSHEEYFDRFYRSDCSRSSETGGSGIGLAVAKAIVSAHHGRITAYSETPTDFTVKAVF